MSARPCQAKHPPKSPFQGGLKTPPLRHPPLKGERGGCSPRLSPGHAVLPNGSFPDGPIGRWTCPGKTRHTRTPMLSAKSPAQVAKTVSKRRPNRKMQSLRAKRSNLTNHTASTGARLLRFARNDCDSSKVWIQYHDLGRSRRQRSALHNTMHGFIVDGPLRGSATSKTNPSPSST